MIRTAAILAALFAAPAFAADSVATLSAQQGTVLVNQGDEFVTATESQALLAGDRVMVMEGGSAEITFADGCVLPLTSGSLVDVPEISTCAGAVANVQNIGPSYAPRAQWLDLKHSPLSSRGHDGGQDARRTRGNRRCRRPGNPR